jgi:hypothetical protein
MKGKKMTLNPGLGLDIGTMNLVSARTTVGGQTQIKSVRDAFLDLPADAEKMLRLSKTPYMIKGDELILLGGTAIEMANIMNREVRRPLHKGLISNTETDALEILSVLIESIVGKPLEDNEVCYYSIPANPLDDPGKSNTYHSGIFERILSELGYDPYPSNEALAIIYSNCKDTTFSGIGISFGAGMVNISASYQTQPILPLQFSLARGGDYIDEMAAQARGSTASRMTVLKESPDFSMLNPQGSDQEALAIFYRDLITYSLTNISKQFKAAGSSVSFPNPVPLIVSGGTSQAKGFLETFQEIFDKKKARLGLPISEIRAATDPLNAVAQGLVVQAIQEMNG